MEKAVDGSGCPALLGYLIHGGLGVVRSGEAAGVVDGGYALIRPTLAGSRTDVGRCDKGPSLRLLTDWSKPVSHRQVQS